MPQASTLATAVDASSQTSIESTLDNGVASDKSETSLGDTGAGELLYTYQDETKRPYTADYLQLKDVWDKEPTMEREIRSIEGYLKQMVVDRKLENSIHAAKEYLSSMEKNAGIEQFESPTRRIAKLLKYIEFRKVVDS